MRNIPGYSVQQEISTNGRGAILRAVRESDGTRVILKVLSAAATMAQNARLKQEHDLIKMLNQSNTRGVTKILELVQSSGQYFLVFEDNNSMSLTRVVGRKALPVSEALAMAVQLTEIIGVIHDHGIVHKDIKPDNILFAAATRRLYISDFGIATLIPRESQAIFSPNMLEGTLSYLSPEQTGRMNRPVDYRTDFYSLGATFYELLTGQLPFAVSDPMELVHCHIAKTAAAPHQLKSDVPEVVSRVVMKLLAKDAEDRYQSAHGLLHDLRYCIESLSGPVDTSHFVLGQQDASGKLQVPQKLYGRATEVTQLMHAFEQVCLGQTQMQLIAGYSGIGKSSLVHEIQKPIVAQRGYYISGKYDQFQRAMPYAALIQAFAELTRQVLTEPEANVARWKARLLAALGGNAQVIIDVIPDVAHIVGAQPPAPDLGPSERANRLQSAFQSFIAVFAQKSHPLVVFLDDLQWADASSLGLLKALVTDPESKYLMLIGAYRENEVSPSHPFMLMLDDLKRSRTPIMEVRLQPLQADDVQLLVSETLGLPRAKVAPLATLLVDKSGGNPFFLRQLLQTIHEDGMLTFDSIKGVWKWDLARIANTAVTTNVVDLLSTKIKRLPAQEQQLLQVAACIGSSFDLALIGAILERPEEALQGVVRQAIAEGLILKMGQVYRFVHDRVQQAAAELLSGDDLARLHAKLGLHLLHTHKDALDAHLIDIVTHLNLAGREVANGIPVAQLADLNLQAARKAKGASAYESALEYINCAAGYLLVENAPVNARLLFDTLYEQAQCQYLCGKHDLADASFQVVMTRCQGREDKAEVMLTRMTLLTSMGKHTAAIAIAREAMRLYDDKFPDGADETQKMVGQVHTSAMALIGKRPIADLVNLAPMTDPVAKMKIRILAETVPAAYFTDLGLYCYVGSKMVLTTMEFGSSLYSAFGFTIFAIVTGSLFGQPQTGYEFGLLGIKLSDKYGDPSYRCKSYMLMGLLINHWTHPLRDNIEYMRGALRFGLEAGDMFYASWAMVGLVKSISSVGAGTTEVIEECQKYVAFMGQKTPELLAFPVVHRDFATYLKEGPSADNGFSNDTYYASISNRELTIPQFAYCVKSMLLGYMFNHVDEGLAKLQDTAAIAPFAAGQIATIDYPIAAILLLGSKHQTAGSQADSPWLKQHEGHLSTLKAWAAGSPNNFSHQLQLGEAIVAQVTGDTSGAIDKFDRAIEAAEANQFVQYVALCNEAAGRFYLAIHKPKFAVGYLQEALTYYRRWGANFKARDFEKIYREHLALIPSAAAHDTTGATSYTEHSETSRSQTNTMDLQTMLKTTQAIAGEMDANKLVASIMAAMLASAGAQRGLLIMQDNKSDALVVEICSDENKQLERPRTLLTAYPDVAKTVIAYVKRTKTAVVLADASSDRTYGGDAHVQKAKIKSLLCVPIEYQGNLRAIAYLENRLAAGVFTKDRVALISVISGQAATALEKAHLFSQLEEQVQERTSQLQAAQQRVISLEKESVETQMAGGFAHEMRNALSTSRYALEVIAPDEEGGPPIVDVAAALSQLEEAMQGFVPAARRAAYDAAVENIHDLQRRSLDAVRIIGLGVNRGLRVTQQILEFSQVGHLTPTNESVDLAALLHKISAEFEADFKSKEIQFRVDMPQEIKLSVKEEHAYSILHNLISNACDAVNSGKGERRIDVRAAVHTGQLQINVEDTGIGIAEESKSRIFQPFFTTKGADGTGLGLGLSKRLVELYGGTLNFTSKERQGANFKVVLPTKGA